MTAVGTVFYRSIILIFHSADNSSDHWENCEDWQCLTSGERARITQFFLAGVAKGHTHFATGISWTFTVLRRTTSLNFLIWVKELEAGVDPALTLGACGAGNGDILTILTVVALDWFGRPGGLGGLSSFSDCQAGYQANHNDQWSHIHLEIP